MTWYLHSWDKRTRGVMRSGPYESSVRAVEAASREWKGQRTPLLIEGPDGEKIEGVGLAERIKAMHREEAD